MATLIIASQKQAKPVKRNLPAPTVQVQKPTPPAPVKESAATDSWVSNVNSRLDVLEKNNKLWFHRLWVFAVANNENANMLRERDGRDYIVFDRDWKLNHLPRTLKLSTEEAEMLKPDLR